MNVKKAVHALIHTHTRTHTHMQMVLLPLCVVVVGLFCFSPTSLHLFFFLRLLDTLLCIGIIMEPCCVISVNFFCYCQQQFFPNFPNLHLPPPSPNLSFCRALRCPILTVLTFVGIIPHIVAAGVFSFCLHSAPTLCCFFTFTI